MSMYDDILLEKLDDGTDEVMVIVHIECDDDDERIYVYDEILYAIEL